MANMQEQLFQIICEQIESIDALTQALRNGASAGNITVGKQPTINALPQKIPFDADGNAKLSANAYRQGFIAVNKTDGLVYGVADQKEASANRFTWMIDPEGSEYYIPANGTYTGDVNFKAVGTGYLMVTEFSFHQV